MRLIYPVTKSNPVACKAENIDGGLPMEPDDWVFLSQRRSRAQAGSEEGGVSGSLDGLTPLHGSVLILSQLSLDVTGWSKPREDTADARLEELLLPINGP